MAQYEFQKTFLRFNLILLFQKKLFVFMFIEFHIKLLKMLCVYNIFNLSHFLKNKGIFFNMF